MVPDLPKANYQVFVSGYGLVDSPRVTAAPGKQLNLTAVIAPNPRAAAEYYPAELLALAAQASRQERVPDPGARDASNATESGRIPEAAEDRRLHVVSSARQQGHPRDSRRPREVRFVGRGLGSVASPRARRFEHGSAAQLARPAARAEDVRGLDRPDCRRRSIRRRRRRVRRAPNAMSSSRSGIGRIHASTSTTSSRATNATRWSTRTGRCMACTSSHPTT